MATNAPVIVPSMPVPTDDPRSLVQSILAIKDNIEVGHNYPRGRPVTTPTAVNVALGAAIAKVTAS